MNLYSKLNRERQRLLPIVKVPALLCLLLGGVSINADEVSDRTAIADVLTQYSYRWDGKDAAGFADLFTEDAIMEQHVNGELTAGSRVVGRNAIYEYALESHRGRLADRQTRHHFSGLVFIELSAESAVTENMALITHQTAADSAPVNRSSGIYRNTWRKTSAGWRISTRILMLDRFSAR